MKKRLALDDLVVKSFVTAGKEKGGTGDSVYICTTPPRLCNSFGQHTVCTLCCPVGP